MRTNSIERNTYRKMSRNTLLRTAAMLVLSAFLFVANSAKAQSTTVQIGTGTTTTYDIPVNNYYNYTYSQQIYTAAEIGAAGVPQTISSIAFQYAYSSATTAKTNCTIYMANTPKTSFTSTTDWVQYANLTPVYTGNLNFPAGVGNWTTFNLSTPFEYDGTSTLLVCVHDNSGRYNSSSYVLYASSATNMALHIRNDGSAYNIAGADTCVLYPAYRDVC